LPSITSVPFVALYRISTSLLPPSPESEMTPFFVVPTPTPTLPFAKAAAGSRSSDSQRTGMRVRGSPRGQLTLARPTRA
jgi:hypothetical protein